jgi:hypothetical protein
MILANPPRVVLDLMVGASEASVAATAAKPTPPQPEPTPAATPVVAQSRPVAPPPPARKPAPAPIAPPQPEPVAAEVAEEVIAIPEIAEVPPIAEPEQEPVADAAQSPEAVAVPRSAAEVPEPIAAEAASPTEGFEVSTTNSIVTGVLAGGVLALLLVVFLVVRRRSKKPDDLDVMALAGDAEAADEAASDDARIPQGGFPMEAPAAAAESQGDDFEFGVPDVPDDENKPIAVAESADEAVHGLFDAAPQEKEAMTMENQDLPMTHMDPEAPTQLGIGVTGFDAAAAEGAPDVSQMLAEFERRMAHLETRLGESIEARETLERQVAAQSEELRVQRAAIARTQRALRSLNRSEEEQATEPALRDPSKPAGPQ